MSSFKQTPQYKATYKPQNGEYSQPFVDNTKEKNYVSTAKIFLSIVSFIFILIGLGITGLASYSLIVLKFITNTSEILPILNGYSMSTILGLLIIGLSLTVLETIIWVAVCKSRNIWAKCILTFFSVSMAVFFAAQTILTSVGWWWFYDVTTNTTDSQITNILNTSISEVYTVCCTNQTDVCKDIFDSTGFLDKCGSYWGFFDFIVDSLKPILGWTLGVMTFLDIVYLVSIIFACCLICRNKRVFYYTPSSTSTPVV